jgi:indolepyruvate ferredoxin oxidoreductase alpha subunit
MVGKGGYVVNSIEIDKPGQRVLLMGNEAVARGAIEAGVDVVAAYPGTPSSEVVGTLIEVKSSFNYYVEWSVNEKVAFDITAGASIVGARSMAVMKNAGLNVAMDTLMTLVYGGIKGGMVIIVADDPGANFSSNEQDSRFAAIASEIPCLEPKNQQEAKDMVKEAFCLSEKLEVPVMIRTVSRVAHGNGDVMLGEINRKKNTLGFNKHWKMPWRWNVYGPPGAVEKHKWLQKQFNKAKELSEHSIYNKLSIGVDNSIGVISSGLANSYTTEALQRLELDIPFLQLGFVNPIPESLVVSLLKSVDKVLVIEEGSGCIVERGVRNIAQEKGIMSEIYGKEYHKFLLACGELNSEMIEKGMAEILGLRIKSNPKRENLRLEIMEKITPRSSTFCAGCGHLGTYTALKRVLKRRKGIQILNGDIGCYEQAGYGIFARHIDINDDNEKKYPISSTYELLDTIYVMGSSLPMAHGQVKAGYNSGKVFAIAGDSTFFHALLPGVVNSIYNNADVTLLILDNYWTAMTGHQPNPSSGQNSLGKTNHKMYIEKIVQAMGAPFVRIANAFNIDEVEKVLEEAIDFDGFSVVVVRGECRLQFARRTDKSILSQARVDMIKCTGCRLCIDIGCPAILFNNDKNVAEIDTTMCNGCDLCTQVCPVSAITCGGETNNE